MKKLFLFLILFNGSFLTVNAQWVDQVSGTASLLGPVFFPSADTGYIAGEVAFLKTTNGGANWNFKSFVPNGYSIYFTSNSTGFCTRNDSLFKTTDGADTWSPVLHRTDVNFQPFFINPDTGFAVGVHFSDSIYVYKTMDAGNTWSFVNSVLNMSYTPIADVHFINDNVGIIVTEWDLIIRTNDGGNTWSTVYDDPLDRPFTSVHFPTSSIGYAVGAIILKSTDAGLTWNELTTPVTSEYLRSVYFTSADTGYVVGGDGLSTGCIIETNDGGANWILSLTASNTFTSVYFPVSDIGYTCGTNGKVMKYTKGANVEDIEDAFISFNCYPNPSNGIFNIQTKQDEVSTIQIVNPLGSVVFEKKLTIEKIQQIDASCLAKGLYYLRVQSEDNVYTDKIVFDK